MNRFGPADTCLPCGAGGSSLPESAPGKDRFWLYVGIAAVFAGQGMMLGLGINLASPEYGTGTYWILHGVLALSALIVLLILGPGLWRETRGAIRRRRPTVEGLFFLSLLGAMGASLIATFTGEGAVYYEVVAIVLAVYSIGKRVGDAAKGRVFGAVERLRSQWDTAEVVEADGELRTCPIDAVRVGTRVRVRAGSRIPVDGIVVEGVAEIEQAAMTGESIPVVVRPGMRVQAGGRSLDGVIEVESTAAGRRRGIDAILRVVEQAPDSPSRLQEEADRLMRYFLPVVVLVSLGTFFGWWLLAQSGWSRALFNSMAVLLVACPCALGLATPMAIWGGLQKMAAKGLIVERATLLDAMARTQMIFFDKTGTLSEHLPRVVDRVETRGQESRIRELLCAVESGWDHPVAASLVQWVATETGAARRGPGCEVRENRMLPGRGIEAAVLDPELGRIDVRIGSEALFSSDGWTGFAEMERDLFAAQDRNRGRIVGMGWNGVVRAVFELRERLRPGVEETIAELIQLGVGVRILTGDSAPHYSEIATVRAEKGLRPTDKLDAIRRSGQAGESPLMIGDGLNDAGAMAAAAGSIAVDSATDLARHRADAILVGDRWDVLPECVGISRSIHRGIAGNLRFAAVYNVIGMSLAAAGQLHPVVAALLMVISSFWVSVRATRSVGEG